MKLEYGKCYLDRMGRKHGPIKKYIGTYVIGFDFIANGFEWREDGTFSIDARKPSEYDLITLVEEPMNNDKIKQAEDKIKQAESMLADARKELEDARKRKLRHGDYGYVNTCENYYRLLVFDGDRLVAKNASGGIESVQPDAEKYTILGNIFDDLKARLI